MKLTKKTLILLTIVILAALLRFYGLGQMPGSLNLDEVAIGYNAFSILETGRDEYGSFMPVAFRSHDDYKAPLYIYMTTAAIYLFGLTPFAVRLVSAVSGIAAVYFLYLLTNQITIKLPKYRNLGYLAALLLAISPWHLQFSRAAFETNLGLMLVILGIYFYLKGEELAHSLKNKNSSKWGFYWFLSILTLGLSLYAYHSTKLFVPLIGLFLIYRSKNIILYNKQLAIGLATVSVVLIMPILIFSSTEAGQLRFQGTSIFNTPTLIDQNQIYRSELAGAGKTWQGRLFHNKYVVIPQVILRGYFSHLSYEFLFYGDVGPPKNYTPNVGLLYLWQLPFLCLGLYWLWQQQLPERYLLTLWLLLTPIASALTWDAPSATRTVLMLPVLTLLVALGLLQLYQQLKIRWQGLYLIIVSLTMIYGLVHYLHNYWFIAPQIYAQAWQYGYQDAAEYAAARLDQVDQVVVSTNLRQPQNFFAFYTQYNPQTYIEVDGGTVSGGFAENRNTFGPYKFQPIEWSLENLETNTYYVDLVSNANSHIPAEKFIYLPNGETYIMIYKHE